MEAPKYFRKLRGVFAVYKHLVKSNKSLEKSIASTLIKELNSMEQRPQKSIVRFLPSDSGKLHDGYENLNLESTSLKEYKQSLFSHVPTDVIDWFDHPLVQGKRYSRENLQLTFGHMLDSKSSGIQLVGLHAEGKRFLDKLSFYKFPRSYHLHGRFGQASLTFDGEGKVIERSTWDHINEAKISRLLCMIQGTFQNAGIKNSGIDLESQHAYRMASKGLLRPTLPSGPTVLELKLVKLDLPDFIVDVTCINESCQYLRKLVHEIGLELKSSAVCTKVWRYRDAFFFAEDDSTLLAGQINVKDVAEIISKNNDVIRNILRRKPSTFKHFSINSELREENGEQIPVTR